MSVDTDSPTWRAVKAAVALDLENDCRLLEGSLDLETTMRVRGRIQAYRSVLALAKTPPPIVDSAELY